MARITINLPDETATKQLGVTLSGVFAAGDIVRLCGDLGAGKSTLARAVIASLSDVDDAPSPTYMLVETYETAALLLWHFDLYRLESAADVWELGLEEALDGGTLLIEWPERIDGLLPKNTLTVRLKIDGTGRNALIEGDKDWRARLAAVGIA